MPEQVSYSSSQFPITINAEYTFKQPINGIASLTLNKFNGVQITKNVTCSGKSTTVFINFVNELDYSTSNYYFTTIYMVFIDPKTNTKVTSSASISIVPYSYIVQIVNDNVYKPGQRIQYTIVAKTLDGKPAPSLRVSVQINQYQTTLTTGRDGTARGSFSTNSSDQSYLNFQANCKQCSSGYSYCNPLGIIPEQGISLRLITQK